MKMKLIAGTLLILAVAAGCTKDQEADPDPGRPAFLGEWTVSSSLKLTYDVNVTADPNSSDGVFIHNFACIGWSDPPAGASIQGNKIILDANQVIGDGLTINGSGTLSGNRITWSYTLFDGADMITVSETYTRP